MSCQDRITGAAIACRPWLVEFGRPAINNDKLVHLSLSNPVRGNTKLISTSKHGRLIDRLAIPVFAALGLLTAPGFSIAEDIEWRQGNNSLILPQYCQDYVSQWDRNIPGRWEKWRAHFGPVFIHMHHYCGGVYAEKKARQTFDKRKRDRWLYEVVNQMQYVSPYCDTKCVLYGELHRRWAWALFQQGNSVEAMKHLELLKAAQVVPAGKQP